MLVRPANGGIPSVRVRAHNTHTQISRSSKIPSYNSLSFFSLPLLSLMYFSLSTSILKPWEREYFGGYEMIRDKRTYVLKNRTYSLTLLKDKKKIKLQYLYTVATV